MGRLENQAVLVLFCCSAVFHLPTALVIGRVAGVEILAIEVILGNAKRIAKPLIMHQFSLSEILDGIAHVGIVGQAQNVVIGDTCLLLC